MKATAIAPSNVAFIKYWGRTDEILRLPTNDSISMNLSNLLTTTTVEFDQHLEEDNITIDDLLFTIDDLGYRRIQEHLDRIRMFAKIDLRAKVVSKNNFPAATGLSSSASGFAALTLAGTRAAGLDFSEKALTMLARQGSGSACRSIPDGFVQWFAGKTSDESYAVSIFPPNHWDIVDVVVILSEQKKKISTSYGHTFVFDSPLFEKRLATIDKKITTCKKFLAAKNFEAFGTLIEDEAEALHELMQTSNPDLQYLFPETLDLIEKIKEWRGEGLPVYYTLNTGHNVHLIIEEKNTALLLSRLKLHGLKEKSIVNHPTGGTRFSEKQLF